jgi:phosphodiesterase/alkaline phosphatase D-like protein
MTHEDSSLTRRQVLAGAGSTGLLAAAGPLGIVGSARLASRASSGSSASSGGAADGTPEQIHLTWGADPASSVTISWASPAQATRPRVLLSRGQFGRTVPATARTYTDGINGETVWTYHAEITGLAPDTGYSYTVTTDNDSSSPPFASTFTTAPRGRAPFRFTSFGDLATPNTQWVLSYGQSACAVAAVESFQPLFHLLNGDLCYADLNRAE